MLAAGTSYALLSTDLVREVLGVPVHGSFGYSLGESSMLFATGGWVKSARGDEKISASPLFDDMLRGPKRTVRALWGLGDDVPDAEVWATHVLLAPADDVRAALRRYDRVFLTHVDTPQEAVVAGDPQQCRDLIAELDCRSARSPANHVMHCPVVDGVLPELADLNRYPTGDVGDLVLYSSRHYAPVTDFDADAVARNIAVTLRETSTSPGWSGGRTTTATAASSRSARAAPARGGSTRPWPTSRTCRSRWTGGAPRRPTSPGWRPASPPRHPGRPQRLRAPPAQRSAPVARACGRSWRAAPRPALGGIGGGPRRGHAAPYPGPGSGGARAERRDLPGYADCPGTGRGSGRAGDLGPGFGFRCVERPGSGSCPAERPGLGSGLLPCRPPRHRRWLPPCMPPRPRRRLPLRRLPGTGRGSPPGARRAPAVSAGPVTPAPDAPCRIRRTRPPHPPPRPPVQPLRSRRAPAFRRRPGRPLGARALSLPKPAPGTGAENPPPNRTPRCRHPTPPRQPPTRAPWRWKGSRHDDSSQCPGAARPAQPRPQTPQVSAVFRTPLPVPAPSRQSTALTGDKNRAVLVRGLRSGARQRHPARCFQAQRERAATRRAAHRAGHPAAPARPSPGVISDETGPPRVRRRQGRRRLRPPFRRDRRAPPPRPAPRAAVPVASRVTDLEGEPALRPLLHHVPSSTSRDAWYTVDGHPPRSPSRPASATCCSSATWVSTSRAAVTVPPARQQPELPSAACPASARPCATRSGSTVSSAGSTPLFFCHYGCFADGELILKAQPRLASASSPPRSSRAPSASLETEVRPPVGAAPTPFQGPSSRWPAPTGPRWARTTSRSSPRAGRHRLRPGARSTRRLQPLDAAAQRAAPDGRRGHRPRPQGRRRAVSARSSAIKKLEPGRLGLRGHFPDTRCSPARWSPRARCSCCRSTRSHLGLHLSCPTPRFQSVPDLRTEVKVRGQITPAHDEIDTRRHRLPSPWSRAPPSPPTLIVSTRRQAHHRRPPGFGIRPVSGRDRTTGPSPAAPARLARLNPASGEARLLSECTWPMPPRGTWPRRWGPSSRSTPPTAAPRTSPTATSSSSTGSWSWRAPRASSSAGASWSPSTTRRTTPGTTTTTGARRMPNCVQASRSGVQAAVLLSYSLGATLPLPAAVQHGRDLDGRATLVKDVDLHQQDHPARIDAVTPATRSPRLRLLPELRLTNCPTTARSSIYRRLSLFGCFGAKALGGPKRPSTRPRASAPWIDRQPSRPAQGPAASTSRPTGPPRPTSPRPRIGRGPPRPRPVGATSCRRRRPRPGYLRGHPRRIRPDDSGSSPATSHRDPGDARLAQASSPCSRASRSTPWRPASPTAWVDPASPCSPKRRRPGPTAAGSCATTPRWSSTCTSRRCAARRAGSSCSAARASGSPPYGSTSSVASASRSTTTRPRSAYDQQERQHDPDQHRPRWAGPASQPSATPGSTTP